MSQYPGGFIGAALSGRILPYLFLALLPPGCGTLLNGSTQVVTLTSKPEGARATIEPGGFDLVTPAQIELSRKHSYRVRFEHDGYRSQVRRISRESDAPFAVSWVLIPLALVDLASGGAFTLEPDRLAVELERRTGLTPDQ
jgi:hypothetical protein